MNRKKLFQSKRKGSAMALMMVALVVLLVTGVGLLSMGLRSRIFALRMASGIAARCAADAGLTKAVFEMNQKLKVKPWTDSNMPLVTDEVLPNCDAIFSYTVTGDSSSGFAIESVGNYGWAEKKVRSTLRLKSRFDYGIFTQSTMDLRNGTTIDAYNLDAGETLKIGTNSTEADAISAAAGVTIDGDVVVCGGGDPSAVAGSIDEGVVTGDIYSAGEYELSSVIAPQYLQALPSQGTIGGGAILTNTGKYDSINLGNSEIALVDGEVILYVTGDIILDNSAQLLIVDANTNPDASLTLYLGGNLLAQNGAFINNLTLDPTRLKIYALDTCQNIDFKSSSVFYGAIYAPEADVHLYNSVDVYGSVVGNTFTQDVSAAFHYDASLRDGTVNDEGMYFVVDRWYEE